MLFQNSLEKVACFSESPLKKLWIDKKINATQGDDSNYLYAAEIAFVEGSPFARGTD